MSGRPPRPPRMLRAIGEHAAANGRQFTFAVTVWRGYRVTTWWFRYPGISIKWPAVVTVVGAG